MEEKMVVCTLITPMFSFGAYENNLELRTAELKGAMRYMYRIACPAITRILAEDEAQLFGAATGAGRLEEHASPIRLMIRGNMKNQSKDLLLHRETKRKILPCFVDGQIQITAYLNPVILRKSSGLCQKVDLEWYENLIKLSLILCGMGRRSRKGRGCFDIADMTFQNKQEMLEWICKTLNEIAAVSSQKVAGAFEVKNQKILSTIDCRDKRPVIQKIWAGQRIEHTHIEGYLLAVDQACHKLKEGDTELARITGNGSHDRKFASPLLIRIVKTKEGYYPVYMLIKGVCNGRIIDFNCSQREQFIGELEKYRRRE